MKHIHLFITVLLVCLCSIARGQTILHWFDSDHEHATASTLKNGTISIDASALSPGVHALHFLSRNVQGIPSSTFSKVFLVTQPATKSLTTEYWFDNDYSSRKNSSTVSGTISIDASDLAPGLHILYYHQKDAEGLPSSAYSHAFIVPEPHSVATKGEYWFDDNYSRRYKLDISSSPTELKIPSGPEFDSGVHAVHFHTLTDDGKPSSTYTNLFWIPAEPAWTASIHFWVNELTDSIRSCALEGMVFPSRIMETPPLVPLRTCMFHVNFSDYNNPMVYAMNTLHIVYVGQDGSISKRIDYDYVDYRVSEPIISTVLQPGESKTVAKPEGLKWFKVQATTGDSLAFKASSPCTMHLYSYNGGELWSVSGDDATKMGGTRADMTGWHYLAVHDVTDASATDVTISYLWEAAPKPSGDVNGDSAVDVADIATIISVMAGETGYTTEQADVNGDSVVDVADIATVISIMAEMARMQQVVEE